MIKKLLNILLDIDGVLVTTPSWKPVSQLADGFLEFNDKCATNLQKILSDTSIDINIVLTTSHRFHYNQSEWISIFKKRGIHIDNISKVNNIERLSDMGGRLDEIIDWVHFNPDSDYIIIDDDKSLNSLPDSIKRHLVITNSLTGLNNEAMLNILEMIRNR